MRLVWLAGTVFTVKWQGMAAVAGLHGPRNMKRGAARSRIRILPKEAVLDEVLLD